MFPFIDRNHNQFLNNLVDRIVTGAPTQEEADSLTNRWGYEDQLINTAEPYHFWAIQGDESLDKKLPLKQAGLNVHWVKDLKPFQVRKVRILNGAHTLNVIPRHSARQAACERNNGRSAFWLMDQGSCSSGDRACSGYARSSADQYAEEVFERFLNPHIDHKLQDIALNTIGKFKVRVLPTLLSYEQI